MTDNPHTARRSTPVNTFVAWLLDENGTLYGDEQERLRWYEAITAAASIQWLVLPWVLAVLVWLGGRPVAPYLAVVFLSFWLPKLLASRYVRSRQVRPPTRQPRSLTAVAVVYLLGNFLMVLGFARAFGLDPDAVQGAVIGGLVGSGFGLVVLVLIKLRRARRGGDGAVA
jgi:hypothetical protein